MQHSAAARLRCPELSAQSSVPTITEGAATQVALELVTRLPELVYRNPEEIEQAWKQMRADRAAFVEFFGCDELVLPPAEAEERINAFYRHRQEAALAGRPARCRPPNIGSGSIVVT
jgi:hypothetical protein